MKIHKWKDIKAKYLSAEEHEAAQKWARQEILEMNLQAVREVAGHSPSGDTPLPTLSENEPLLSTMRKYVEALGGTLEVVAVFDDKQVRLHGI